MAPETTKQRRLEILQYEVRKLRAEFELSDQIRNSKFNAWRAAYVAMKEFEAKP